jgi:ribonuclease HII
VSARGRAPTRAMEKALWAMGHQVVVGIDEVGRGSWAGPLAVGAAVLPRDTRVNGIRDSKVVSERAREEIFDRLAAWCLAWGVGMASHEECDALGMAAAQRLATGRALEQLGLVPDAAVSDGTWDFITPLVPHVEMRVKADQHCLSVATASILAKVQRDREMRSAAQDYPFWSFESNKGYPCATHRAALGGYGPSAIHRRSWVFMDNYVPWTGISRRVREDQPRLF